MLKLCAFFFPRDAGQGCVCVYECVCFVFQTLVCRTAERAAGGGGELFLISLEKESKRRINGTLFSFYFYHLSNQIKIEDLLYSPKDWLCELLRRDSIERYGITLMMSYRCLSCTPHACTFQRLFFFFFGYYRPALICIQRLISPVCLSWPTGHDTPAHCSTCVVRLAPPTFFRLNVCSTLPSKKNPDF